MDEDPDTSILAELKTDLHPCSIEAVNESAFLLGLYELDEAKAVRRGSLILCDVDATLAGKDEGEGDGEGINPLPIISRDRVETDGGVLDCKISNDMVAATLSTGRLDLLSLNVDEGKLMQVSSIANEDEGLFLSVDWETGALGGHFMPSEFRDSAPSSNTGKRLVVSTQQSSLMVYELNAHALNNDPIMHVREAHCLCGEAVPVWITAFNPNNTNIIISGGDDCSLRLWDIRTGPSDASGAVSRNTKEHTAGVTSAQWHPLDEHLFLTGSYDGAARLWDARAIQRPLNTINTSGGVWRAKWWINPCQEKKKIAGGNESVFELSQETETETETTKGQTNEWKQHLALACMHAGSGIFGFGMGSSAKGFIESCSTLPSRIGRHYQHSDVEGGHLAYGLSILRENVHESTGKSSFIAASCSFYDDLVQIWETNSA